MINLVSYWKTLLWSILMLILFLLPADSLGKAPPLPYISETIHILTFSVFTWLLIRERLAQKSMERPLPGLYLSVFLISVVIGGLIELLQHFSHLGRSAEFIDLVYDMVGSLLGLILIFSFYRFRKNLFFKD